MAQNEEEKWITGPELAVHLGYHRDTIANMRAMGMPFSQSPGAKRPNYRYKISAVEAWLNSKAYHKEVVG